MRILKVTQTYFPFLEFGGPPVKVRALARALARRGHRVTVLTADWGLQRRFAGPTRDGGGERTPYGWQIEEDGVQAIYLPTWLRYRTASWHPRVGRFCRARLGEFDVAHIFGLYDLLGPKVAAGCRVRGVPYVVEPIGMFVPIVRNFWLKRMYHLLLGQQMLDGAQALIATSEQECAELAAAGLPPDRIVLRRNGVDMPPAIPQRGGFRRDHGIPENAKLVLFLGRLSSKKSPELLLEAFAALCKRGELGDVYLAFVGPDEGKMKNHLKSGAKRLGIAPQVRFCDPLFSEKKWSAYRDADVFVLPSQNENFGNTAAEAAMLGTPVIVTEKCGVAPLLANVAGLVVQHEVSPMSEAMQRILGDARLRAELSAGGRDLARRLDWEGPASEMEALYSGMAPRAQRCIAHTCAR